MEARYQKITSACTPMKFSRLSNPFSELISAFILYFILLRYQQKKKMFVVKYLVQPRSAHWPRSKQRKWGNFIYLWETIFCFTCEQLCSSKNNLCIYAKPVRLMYVGITGAICGNCFEKVKKKMFLRAGGRQVTQLGYNPHQTLTKMTNKPLGPWGW